MKNSYRSHNGKYQTRVDEIEQSVPSFGYTYNPNMNLFLLMSHLYYDAHNNGVGNIMECYASDYEKYMPEELKQKIKLESFTMHQPDAAEKAMDTVIEYLDGADLRFPVFTLWRNNDCKQYCLTEQTGGHWFAVTFGSMVEKIGYIRDMEKMLGYCRLTLPKKSPFKEIPALCSRCGEHLQFFQKDILSEVWCPRCGFFHADVFEHGKVTELYHNDGFGACTITGSAGPMQQAFPCLYSRDRALTFFDRCKAEYEGSIDEATLTWWDGEISKLLTLADEKPSGK